MQIVIDIPEDTYEKVMKTNTLFDEYSTGSILSRIIQNGTPLEKMRAEIEAAMYIDKDTKLCKNANASGLEVALKIIDKYKAESEG